MDQPVLHTHDTTQANRVLAVRRQVSTGIGFILALSWLWLAPCWAGDPRVAVLYPDMDDPYRKVFLDIVRGVESELAQPVKTYVLDRDQQPTGLAEQLKQDRIEVAITLGRAGYAVAKPLSMSLPVVIGAVLLAPGQDESGLPGISLTPDPAILFSRLRDLVPDAREVTVVYDTSRSDEEIVRAQNAAKSQGLVFHALAAADLRQAAALYHKVLLEVKDSSVAVWLPHDNAALDEQALLPQLLREAWDKNFVVFSSNLDHVRKGALFALYPDNVGMGRSLAAMARSRAQVRALPANAIEPLRDVQLAVNLRTAEHLGLSFAATAMRRFGVTFPSQP